MPVTESASESARIGIFGGAFNPPHVAHLIIAEIIRDQFELETILWIPGFQSPHKSAEELAPAEDRLEMTRLLTRENAAFAVSHLEIQRGGVSYTVETLRNLQNENPTADFRLIIGTDSLRSFSAWHEPEEILRRVPLVVFPRRGSEYERVPPQLDDRVAFADAPVIEISSTMIRERLRDGRSIRYLVPESVRRYIEERRLYLQPV